MTTDAAPPILETSDLEAGYGEVNVLQGVSITVRRGSIVSVIGPNGAGKSTLLKTFYGFLKPRGGNVVFHGDDGPREIGGLKPHALTALGLNYVPQLDNAFANMTVRENLEIGAFLRRAGVDEQIERMFAWFPRLAERRKQRAGTLSGGERQMLALARALMVDPQLLLLDEPSAGLAPRVVDEIFVKIREINETGVSIVIVEQNARKSLAMSDYGYVLDLGRNRFEGPGPELLENERVADLYLGGRGRFATSGATDDAAADRPPTTSDPAP